jgi:hypothetical protein
MKSLPLDENNPATSGAFWDELILWLAYKEAKAMIHFDETPPLKGKNIKNGRSWPVPAEPLSPGIKRDEGTFLAESHAVVYIHSFRWFETCTSGVCVCRAAPAS